MRRRTRRWTTAVAVVAAVLWLAVPPGLAAIATAGPSSPPTAPVTPSARPAGPPTTWTVNGSVLTHSGFPVAGANVSIVDAPCPVLPDPNDDGNCTFVASGTTDSSGNFSVPIPAVTSSYWVYSHPADGYGGDYDFLPMVHGPVGSLALSVWPYRPYGNTTIVLPSYTDLAPYACNGQGSGKCGTSFQVPILSWTADGATYVNASDDLVFYSFPNGTVRLLARAWTPLYQNFMRYGGVEDTEWVTGDGSYVYTLGCPESCTRESDLEFEAVNISTGRLVTHTWNTTANSTVANGQGDLIGLNGSDDVAVLIDQNGTLHLYGLSNRTEWVGGRLAFFEANNVYWVPELNSYIDIQAGGSLQDRVVQYRFNGTGFRIVYSGSWGDGVVGEFVNGLVYNLSAHEIYFETGAYGYDALVTDALTVGPGGTIVASHSLGTFSNPSWPERKWTEVAPSSSEHRIAPDAWGPSVAADFSPLFGNSSWLQDPTTRSWFDTNQTMDDSSAEADNAPETVEGLFYNGSYAIDPASLYCAGTGNKNWSPGVCPLEGTFPGTAPGTVWWFWQIGQPEFPFPSDAPLAEPLAPPAPTVRLASIGATTLRVNWTVPSGEEEPLLNWTVLWGTSPGAYTDSASVVPWARSFEVPGLTTGVTYYIGVRALNHHWFGPLGATNGTPIGPPPTLLGAPTGLAVAQLGLDPTLVWTNPAGAFTNTTVLSGASCSDLSRSVTLPGAVDRYVAPAVPNGTTEFFAVADWAPAGRTDLSNCVGDAPPAPAITYATAQNETGVELYLSESLSPVFNHTLRYGAPSCTSFPYERATGNGGPWAYESRLNASQSYCFEAASWSYGGESPWSAPVVAATFGPTPGPPVVVSAVPNALGEVVVDWGNPTGPVTNDTVLWGDSCATLGNATSTGVPATTEILDGVPNGTAEWFSVTAWGPGGPSVPSECVSDASAAPSIVSATPAGAGAVAILVSDRAPSAYDHSIGYGPAPCGPPQIVRKAGNASDRLVLDGLAPSTEYCIEVASWTLAGRSGFGPPVAVTTWPAPPPAPTGLAVRSSGVDSVTLAWTDPTAPVTNVTLELGEGCGELAPWGNVSPSVGEATVAGLSASTTYCLSVEAWNGSMGSPMAAPVRATTSSHEGLTARLPPSAPPSPIPGLLLLGALGLLGAALVVAYLRGRGRRRPPMRPEGSGAPRGGGVPREERPSIRGGAQGPPARHVVHRQRPPTGSRPPP
jgi:hypothetical protein